MVHISRPRLQPLYIVKLTLGILLTFVVFTVCRALFVISSVHVRKNAIFEHYVEALGATEIDNTVILAPFDSGFVDMTANFYVSSIRKHGIENILFIAMDDSACARLLELLSDEDVKCVLYTLKSASGEAAVWGSDEFRHKNMIKRSYILEALHAGYTTLMTDVDMVYIRNPLPDLNETCMAMDCDLAIQWDSKHDNFNGGFIYARYTLATVLIYERQMEYDNDDKNRHRSDQQQLNVAVQQISQEGKVKVTVIALNTTKYPVGKPFFFKRRCPPKEKYDDVVVLHNNYIREKENKIFRLKECMLWEYDGPDGYYTNPKRAYLTYQYSLNHGKYEYQGLLNAFCIGKILNRTVILPNTFFREGDVHTNLMLRIYQKLSLYFMRDFHELTGGNYRESSFLVNPRVPETIIKSRSNVFHIETFICEETKPKTSSNIIVKPNDIMKGPTVQEIRDWFGGVQAHVLQFDTLYGEFSLLDYETCLCGEFINLVRPLDGPLRFLKYLTQGKIEMKLKMGKEIHNP